jgi:raffinose/stachyose/melibiose transport system permease protein
VVEAGIIRYFFNSVIVTVGAAIQLVLSSFLASYAIVRGDSRLLRFSRSLFLLGLAIPLQATIIPLYLIVTKIHMYDTLGALILPFIAFGIPLSVLILSNFIRDVPRELFESMRLYGCTDWQMAWRLAFPLTRPAIVTVSIYNGLNVWNGFLFALILTQSPEKRVMPLALWAFQMNIPAVLAAVVLSTLPILILYVVGRRQLLRGLTAGFGK